MLHFRFETACLFCIFISTLIFTAAKQVAAQEVGNSFEQTDPLGTQYYLNRYLGNPAMAGRDTAINLDAVYRGQFQSVPGAPVTQAFSADAYFGKRVGAGLMVYQDEAGLLNRNRVAMTYAYHLPLNGGAQLHFGLSLALLTTRADYSKIEGDAGDPAVSEYNRSVTHFEGDFGMAYTDEHWTLQAALPNLVGFFKKDVNNTADVSSFYTAASYRFGFEGQLSSFEPEVCYRGVKGYKGLVDAGFRAGFLGDQANLYAMYHSSGNFSAGAGYTVLSTVTVQALYTSQTSGLRTYFGGTYQLGLKIRLFRNSASHWLD